MQDFEYISVDNVDEAVHHLVSHGARARVLAGGTDILNAMRERRIDVDWLVDIKAIPEVNQLKFDPQKGLILGAAVPCFRLWNDPDICDNYPGLVDAFSMIGGIQIQGRASVGGNLCNASPAADTIPALIAYSAVCRVAGPEGEREVPVEDFCTGPGKTVLREGEFLVALHVPTPPAGFGAHYLRFTPRNEMDIAVIGCGASVRLDPAGEQFQAARIALGAVAPVPLFLPEIGAMLAGEPVSDAAIDRAAIMAQEAARPIDDLRGSAVQRKHLAGVLAKRALNKAIHRARIS